MLTTHLLRPLLVFAALAFILEFTTLDLWVADHLYRWSGDVWRWRDAWLISGLIHQGGRTFSIVLLLLLVALLGVSYWVERWQPLRRGFCYVVASALLSVTLVNLLKQLTPVNCPWDLLRYGGRFDYVRTFAGYRYPESGGGCFPAGHASAAYCWLGLYYVAREYQPRWRYRVLVGVLLMGGVFGGAQQLRGAHFLSHDLWTLAICWFSATALALGMFPVPARAKERVL